MLASRSLILVALTGLLAASCNAAVIPTPYGQAAINPPKLSLIAVRDHSSAAPVSSLPSQGSVSPPGSTAAEPASDTEPATDQPAPVSTSEGAQVPNSPAPAPSDATVAQPSAPTGKAMLGPLEFISQTLNNCGPASIAEVLAFWGVNRTQTEIQSVLRGDGNPYGMTPAGVPAYIASLGMDAVLGTGGSAETIKALVRAGFPVIVNQTVSPTDLEFHYRPVAGFDDGISAFIASDPLIGPQHAISYAEFEQDWIFTGHRFMVIYPPAKTAEVNAALASAKWDPAFAEGGAQAQAWSVPGAGGPPPITIAMFGGKPALAGWSTAPVSVGFRATDQSGFGVANTSYAIDKQPVQLYRGEFTIKDPGKHVVTFHSVNFTGSREQDKTVNVDIDSTAPVTTASVDGVRDGGAYVSPARLVLAATDDVSGVEKTTYSIDGAPAAPYSAPVALSTGAHVVIYSSVDWAGNKEAPKSLPVTVIGRAGASAVGAPSGSAPASASASAAAGGYSLCYLYDLNKPLKPGPTPGSPLIIKLQLCDGSGKNRSAPSIALTEQYIIGPPTQSRPALPTPFHYEPSFNGYQAEAATGLAHGSYALYFTAAGDPTVHMLTFIVGS